MQTLTRANNWKPEVLEKDKLEIILDLQMKQSPLFIWNKTSLLSIQKLHNLERGELDLIKKGRVAVLKKREGIQLAEQTHFYYVGHFYFHQCASEP